MAETENNNKFKMQFIDKFIISMIGVANVIVIIITIISVNRNYQKMYEEQLKKLDEIPYNETYKYLQKGDEITFYKETTPVAEYKCTKDCNITKFSSSQFIIDNDDLIPIADDGKVNLYSIKDKKNSLVLDDIPQTSINNRYGIIRINGKDGVLNKHGTITLECIYNDVDINTSHMVTLGNNTIYVFDNTAKLLSSKQVSTTGDISISEKNNNLYINIFGNQTTTLVFDTKSNKFTS